MEGRWGLVLISITVAALAILGVKLLNWLWFRPRNLENFLRNEGLDGNSYRPVLGDLKDFARITKEVRERAIQLSDDIPRQLYPYYVHIISKYGPKSFVWLGPYPRLNIVDPEMIKEILQRFDVFEKGHSEAIKTSFAGGLASLEGEKWAHRRKIINPAFHVEKLKNMVPAIGLSCSDMLSKWEAIVSCSEEGWSEIDVWPFFQDLTGDVISRTAFGSNYEEGRKIFQLRREQFSYSFQLMRSLLIPGWRHLPTKTNRRMKAITKEIRSILRAVIDKRQNTMESGEEVSRDDLLGILMESNSRFVKEEGNENAGMSTEDVIEECQLFYFAGSDSTSTLLVWAMVLLCQYPEWQTRARDEVLRVLGHSHPTTEALNHLKIVTMIIQEVLRLYPPIPLTTRRTKETVKLKNLTIPEGVDLTILIGVLHYDPEIWGEDAKEFKPQRFSEGVANAAKFLPFGSGPRSCIGQNLAMIGVKMALAMILQRYSFELSPSYSHSPLAFVTTTPQFGAPLILRTLSLS